MGPADGGIRRHRRDPDDAIGNKGDINMFSLGLVYRFGENKPAHVEKAAPPVAVAAAPVWVIVPVVAMAIFMGVFPGVFLKPMQPSVERFLQRMSHPSVARAVEAPSPNPADAAWRGAAASGARVKH